MEWSTVLWLGGGGGVLIGLGYEIAKLNTKYRKIGLVVVLSGVALLAGLLVANFWPTQKPTEQAAAASSSKSLGFTVAEFKNRFNQAAKRVGVKLRVDKIAMDPVTEGDAREMFRVPFGDAVAILGGADLNTHALTEFLVLFVWSENEKMNEENLLKLLACSTVLIEMCNPGLTGEQRVGILHEVGLFGEKGGMAKRRLVRGDVYKTSTQKGSIKYTFREALGEKAILTVQSL